MDHILDEYDGLCIKKKVGICGILFFYMLDLKAQFIKSFNVFIGVYYSDRSYWRSLERAFIAESSGERSEKSSSHGCNCGD